MQPSPYPTLAAQLRLAARTGIDVIEPEAGAVPLTSTERAEFPQWPADLLMMRGGTSMSAIQGSAVERANLLAKRGVVPSHMERPEKTA